MGDVMNAEMVSSAAVQPPGEGLIPPAGVLRCESVEFGYHAGEPVLRGVTAELGGSQVCALVGPNASGKSTLLSVMMGMHDAWRGRVSLDGRDVSGLAPAERARLISYVPQRTRAGFAFTVEQVVAMARQALERDVAAVEDALVCCDLVSLRRRVFMELSAGQQQRVLLARAVAQSRGGGRVMLLDEPTSAMDLEHVHDTMRTLRSLAGAGLSVLVVLHDLNLAAQYADSAWVVDGGQLVAAGPWERVLEPGVLEEVFRVGIKPMGETREGRPLFAIQPRGSAGGAA